MKILVTVKRVTDPVGNCGVCSLRITTSSGRSYGSGDSRTAFETVNTAALAPMPNPRATMAANVNQRSLTSRRAAKRRS